jgi:peptidoglycan hydrolase CwlO-like protein
MEYRRFLKKSISFILALIISSSLFFELDNSFQLVEKAIAYETTCPAGLSDAECLAFLRDQVSQINNEKNAINGAISKEQYAQMDLGSKISYLNGQIGAKESVINTMEIDIETKNVEIRIIGKNIQKIQDSISTLTQETDQLRDTIGKRISMSYKYDKMSPLEVMLSTDNFDTMLRKTKYLLEARKKDRDQLEQLSYNLSVLKTENDEMLAKKADIQLKRNEIENKKADIFVEKQALVPQQTELNTLIAESKKREAESIAQRDALAGLQNGIDSQIQAMIMKMFHEGQLGNGTYVAQGQIIGFQGHTGCAFGSHLHFGMNQWNSAWWNSDLNPFDGYLNGGAWAGSYVTAGSASAPLDGAYVTQGFHSGMFLDLVSVTAGDQSGNYYYVNPGDIACSPGTSGWMSLTGEGAPVYSVLAGTIYNGVDYLGAHYALVDHGNGLLSVYLHLKPV